MELMWHTFMQFWKEKDKNKLYRIANEDIMEYLSLRRNAPLFLQCYNQSFNRFRLDRIFVFLTIQAKNFENLKESYEDFIIAHTPIKMEGTECRRIFTKVINPLAFLHGMRGTEKGRWSSLSKITAWQTCIVVIISGYISDKPKIWL